MLKMIKIVRNYINFKLIIKTISVVKNNSK
jgi:hypothetical protein